jgi:hypothetical protein
VKGWIRLHNEVYNLNTSPNIIRVSISMRMRWMVNVVSIEEMRNAYNTVLGEFGKRQLKDLGIDKWISEWMDLREIGWEGANWIHLAQDSDQRQALMNTIQGVGMRFLE